ncbi:transmembrane protein 272 isoform X2 [Lepisosteus oculatus]|nr:PREDICTED: uncharacterized protein LOC107076615 isoform X2 [Lepisosteus oculatus]XP_015196233.1 PREDICTED: uncharacterized protein LOC107076615 isoform X2 [Lepisosteus oculatus]XP_015196234.1 PREDICTED: uncharacterized protein LOC107076615 isoform X2 [Lepisosteus oculatus]XP_015196235.1 PREDICTED: uncharacterized protein LOC107076615 isoform X2 [Lepisosteus oculatus]
MGEQSSPLQVDVGTEETSERNPNQNDRGNTGVIDFLQCCCLLLLTLLYLLFRAMVIITLCVLPIAEIAIGALYLKDCPFKPFVPVYLLVMGVFSLLLGPLLIAAQLTGERAQWLGVAAVKLLCTFLFCWSSAGIKSIMTLEPSYLESSLEYCNKTLFEFTSGITAVTFAVGLLWFVWTCGPASLLCLGSFFTAFIE